jgi:xanthine dehydrogenase large subunit
MTEALRHVGRPVAHDSADAHVRGQAVYIDDVILPTHALHAAIITSPHAHAKIIRRNYDAVRAYEGVIDVADVRDIRGHNNISPTIGLEPLFADEIVDYVGCPVAAVIASSHEAAVRAARLAAIEYEILPALLTIPDALAARSYLFEPQIVRLGDAHQHLSGAPHQLTGRVEIGGQDHFYLETNIAIAFPLEQKQWHIMVSSQHPTEVQKHVAGLLGVSQAAVTVEVRRMGGGFGGKESQPSMCAGIAAICAAKVDRPVKLRLNRDDDMTITGKRHDFVVDWRVGFQADGRIDAVVMQLVARGGNVADLSLPVLTRALCHATHCYYIPHVELTGICVKTHTVSNTAFRGFGGPQGIIAAEDMIDGIARHLGLARDEVRDRNYYSQARGEEAPFGQIISDNALPDMMAQLYVRAHVAERQAEISAFNASHSRRKRALATMPVLFGISFNMPSLNQGAALVHVYADGSVQLNHGGTEMGQGLYVKVAQVVAEIFAVDLSCVVPTGTRTDKVPNTSATAASSGSDINGAAARAACLTIRQRMADFIAGQWGVDASSVRFRDGMVRSGAHEMSFAQVAHECWFHRISLSSTGFYATPDIHWDQTRMKGSPFYYFAYGAAVSEVEVDGLTGCARCVRTDIIHDCGQSLNPAIDRGQIEGGFVQGMGWMMMEELYWNRDGALLTHAPSTYKIPCSRDVPAHFNVHILSDHPNRAHTIFRSKAIGEPPLMLAISVWLALRDAVAAFGPPSRQLLSLSVPATPECVLRAIENRRALRD